MHGRIAACSERLLGWQFALARHGRRSRHLAGRRDCVPRRPNRWWCRRQNRQNCGRKPALTGWFADELADTRHAGVVPGGGLSPDDQWIACSPGFFLPVRVLSRLFRRLFLEALEKAHAASQLQFFGDLEPLRNSQAFAQYLVPLRDGEWVVYAKPPFGGPQQVLDYLGRYTHRVAISNQRLAAMEDGPVSFRWKDYRHQQRSQLMTVSGEEFIRRFLLHALPTGFQRIRYYGFLAKCHRAGKLDLCRQLLTAPLSALLPNPADYRDFYAALAGTNLRLCPQCGIGTMIRIQLLLPCLSPLPIRMDTS